MPLSRELTIALAVIIASLFTLALAKIDERLHSKWYEVEDDWFEVQGKHYLGKGE